jgi:hypothetical protein
MTAVLKRGKFKHRHIFRNNTYENWSYAATSQGIARSLEQILPEHLQIPWP